MYLNILNIIITCGGIIYLHNISIFFYYKQQIFSSFPWHQNFIILAGLERVKKCVKKYLIVELSVIDILFTLKIY